MPRKKPQRRNPRKKQPEQDIARSIPRMIYPGARQNGTNGFPAVQHVALTYESQHTLAPGAAIAQYTYRGNSLYDPDYTGAGSQPRYYDTYATIYGKYRVFGSRITVDIINGGGAAAVSMAVLPWTDVVTFTSWPQVAELPESRVATMVPIASRVSKRLVHAASTSTVCGLRARQVMDEDWGATVGSNPLQIWYWNVCVASVDGTSNVTVSIRVRLEFDCEFYDRTDPGLSVVEDPESNHQKKQPDPPYIVYNQVLPLPVSPTSLGCQSNPRPMGCQYYVGK